MADIEETAKSTEKEARKPLGIYVILFFAVFLIHSVSPVVQSGDSRFFLHIADAFSHTGSLVMDDYKQAIYSDPALSYPITTVNGHLYSIYPPALPLMISPIIWVFNAATGNALHHALLVSVPLRIEVGVASLIIALTTLIILAILRHWLPMRWALAMTMVFAFGSAAWSTASRGLWQHGPTMLLLSVALLFIVDGRQVAWAGFFGGLAYAVRPTSALPLAVIAVYLFICNRRVVVPYVVLTLLAIVPLTALTYSIYGTIQAPIYADSSFQQGLSDKLNGSTAASFSFEPSRMVEGLVGNLISPSRGLLIYEPAVLIAVAGAYLSFRQRDKLAITLTAITIFYWIGLSIFPFWWGGHSFGPRYLSDVTPYLVVLTVPAIEWLRMHKARKLKLAVCALVAASIFINARGAIANSTWLWNDYPTDVDKSLARLWDWSDPQFLR